MTIDNFAQSLARGISEGQRHLSNTLRTLVYKADTDLFDVLEATGGEAFLEPTLFAYFVLNSPRISLPQILVGYLDESMCPDEIEVCSDAVGTIYLPHIGYFITEARNRQLVLRWEPRERSASVVDGEEAIKFRFEEMPKVPGTDIEICRHGDPLLPDLIAECSDNGADFRVVDERTHLHVEHLATAMDILREVWPAYYDQIVANVRRVVLFTSTTLNSFASISAHGAVFLNVSPDDDEVFFIDDLLHQCGHVMFNAFTVHRKQFFEVDPDTPIGTLCGDPRDERSVYIVLHAAFTEFAMIHGLRLCLERNIFSGRKAHELCGRLAFIAQKMAIDMENLSHQGLITLEGRKLYEGFRAEFELLRARRPELFTAAYNMSNQPYNFSYERFACLNPTRNVLVSAA